MQPDELKAIKQELKTLREQSDRLLCHSVALISVLKDAQSGDGKPILNHERWEKFQQRLTLELKAKGLD
jgi:hypothetical protein